MVDHETRIETAVAGAKIAPAIGGSTLYALTLNEWVALVTIIYVVLQIGLLIPKYWAGFKKIIGKK